LKRNEKFYTIHQIYFNTIIDVNGKKTKDTRQVVKKKFSDYFGIWGAIVYVNNQKVGDVSPKHRVGDSRLDPVHGWQFMFAVVLRSDFPSFTDHKSSNRTP
jgi:hypothetical protein